ncbi:MAG: heparan-alpha-glucosaminide N-acetyltransferase domain-containing protein, partial [Propionibacteriaceae bacterium]|nr:heparan-alpha-glucosaminide N-acetyltransferase domain-containing protein [Propionibacteriaceae bacterium]
GSPRFRAEMSTREPVEAGAAPSTPAPRPRLVGIDAARGLALLGMIAVHVYRVAFDDWSPPQWMYEVLLGRSAALFAVLAGVGLALLTGGSRSVGPDRARADRKNIAARAGVIAAIGLSLGLIDTELNIILVQYAVMFLLALPFTTMPLRRLAVWAIGWTLLSPVLALLAHSLLPDAGYEFWLTSEPNWASLITPVVLVVDLIVTGSYPVLQWFSFFLFGLVVGRLQLGSVVTQVRLIAVGALLSLGARFVSALLMGPGGGAGALRESTGTSEPDIIEALLGDGGAAWWLAIDAPHTGTTPALLDSMGSAALVLGLCLLIGRRWEKVLAPLAGAGAMTLTFYSAHLLLMALITGVDYYYNEGAVFWSQAAVALAVGGLVRHWGRRGPLEKFAHWAGQRARTVARQ